MAGRGPWAHRVPERAARGRRHRPLRRPADVQLRVARGGHGRLDHARDPRRRPHLEHAEANPDPACPRSRAAHVRARRQHPRHRRQEAVEAPRRGLRRRVPGRGVPGRRARELPGADRMGARRRNHDHVPRRDSRAVLARGGERQPGNVRLCKARLDERRLPARARSRLPTRTRSSATSTGGGSSGPRSGSGRWRRSCRRRSAGSARSPSSPGSCSATSSPTPSSSTRAPCAPRMLRSRGSSRGLQRRSRRPSNSCARSSARSRGRSSGRSASRSRAPACRRASTSRLELLGRDTSLERLRRGADLAA